MITWAVTDFAGYLPDTYYSLYVEGLGASAFTLGVILSISSVVMAFLQFLGGYWADKYGRKQLIVTMSLGRVLIFLIFAVAPTWHFILLAEVLLGMSVVSMPATMAIVADSLPPEKRGLGYSLTLIAGATSIISPLIAGILYLACNLIFGMRIAYVIVAACWLIAGLLLSKLVETMEKDASSKLSLKEGIRQYPNAVKDSITVWRLVPRSALNLLLVYAIATLSVRMCLPYYLLYANHVLKIEEFQWALMQTWSALVFYVSALPIGKIVDMFGRKKPLMASSALFALSLALFLFGDVPKLYVFFALSSLGNALVFIAYPALQADLVPKEYRGKVTGFTNFLDSLLASGGILLGGFIYENISQEAPFQLQLLTMILTIALTFLFIQEAHTREK